jgi:glycosyltransferase involved in cell wall biosynthesis
VDDLEESARLNGWTLQALICRWLEPKLLREAERVFTISPGYCEHLDGKYDIAAQWLPISIPQDKVEHRPYVRQEPDVRSVVFIGAVNPLYANGLKDCFHAIRQWNQSKKSFKLNLLVMTYGHEWYVRKEVGDGPELEVLVKPSPDEFQRRMWTSWAAFLPYSADNAVRVMVSTSFPTKLTESISAGRPVVVYGPKYASVPRYFLENRLPLLANTPEELQHVLERIAQVDSPKLIAEYGHLIRSLHSPERLKSLLA